MTSLRNILFDTVWGPAVAWLVASVVSFGLFNLLMTGSGQPFAFLAIIPLVLAALVALSAFILSLIQHRWLHALLQLLLLIVAQAATGAAAVPLYHTFFYSRSSSASSSTFHSTEITSLPPPSSPLATQATPTLAIP